MPSPRGGEEAPAAVARLLEPLPGAGANGRALAGAAAQSAAVPAAVLEAGRLAWSWRTLVDDLLAGDRDDGDRGHRRSGSSGTSLAALRPDGGRQEGEHR